MVSSGYVCGQRFKFQLQLDKMLPSQPYVLLDLVNWLQLQMVLFVVEDCGCKCVLLYDGLYVAGAVIDVPTTCWFPAALCCSIGGLADV